jgi:GNAT superfamily N-acetyltransferase
MTDPRRLSPGDPALAQVLPLVRAAFAFMEERIDPPSSIARMTEDDLARAAEEGEVWGIGEPLLACMVLTPREGALQLGRLAVADVARRQGHARALLAAAEERARALGLPALELKVRIELVENHAAFRALGFEETAREAHPGYVRPTTLVFRKAVPPPKTPATPPRWPRRRPRATRSWPPRPRSGGW